MTSKPMSAVPNLFEFIIEEALAQEGATVESVALFIAKSDMFLKGVGIGMAHEPPAGQELPNKAQVMRVVLGQAFSAPTANSMFKPLFPWETDEH
jgi:hypothetical protein